MSVLPHSRAIPTARPGLLAEIVVPAWHNVTGPEPAFVDGRLYFYGGKSLFEIDEDWRPVERLLVGHEGRAVLPVPLGGGGLGVASSATYHSTEAVVLDAACQPISRVPLAKTATILDDITTRACAGALVVGWSGQDRTGVSPQSGNGGISLREVISIDAGGPRFTLAGAGLLGSCGDTLVISRDDWPKEATFGVDGLTGEERWRNEEPFEDTVRAERGANDDCFFVVEHFRHLEERYSIAAFAAKDGRERWRTRLGRYVSSMRVCGSVIALSIQRGVAVETLILDSRTGAIVAEKPRPEIRHALFPPIALDHSRVLWRRHREILCERHTGELDWTLPLPFKSTTGWFGIACADGRIALRYENRIWIYGE